MTRWRFCSLSVVRLAMAQPPPRGSRARTSWLSLAQRCCVARGWFLVGWRRCSNSFSTTVQPDACLRDLAAAMTDPSNHATSQRGAGTRSWAVSAEAIAEQVLREAPARAPRAGGWAPRACAGCQAARWSNTEPHCTSSLRGAGAALSCTRSRHLRSRIGWRNGRLRC